MHTFYLVFKNQSINDIYQGIEFPQWTLFLNSSLVHLRLLCYETILPSNVIYLSVNQDNPKYLGNKHPQQFSR